MFPWVDGFHWTPVHIIFLTLFFAAVTTILSTLALGIWRTAQDFRANRITKTYWRGIFADLPEAERRCRHEFAGRVASRTCDNAFDCRTCRKYADFAPLPAKVSFDNAGVGYFENVMYHRGHTWVLPELDGTLTIGLDEFARHLIGHPDSVELPPVKSSIESDGIAWSMRKNGHEIKVRAPIDGTVIATGGENAGWYLRIKPHGPVKLRHLLAGPEVVGWLRAEIDRLQMQLGGPNAAACLADGGMLMPNLMDAEPQADWDAVLAGTFLDV